MNTKRGIGLLPIMQAHMKEQANKNLTASTGYVTSFNGVSCKVMLEPSGIETGWLPVCSAYVGSGFGFLQDIEENTECTVVFEHGDINCGKIVAFHFHDDNPPSIVPGSGVAIFKHKSGSTIQFNDDGSVNITAAGGTTITSDIKVNGSIETTGDVVAAGISLDSHVHGGVETGGGKTSGPQ